MQVFLTEWFVMLPGSLAAFAAFERNFPISFFPSAAFGYQICELGRRWWLIGRKNGESGCFISRGRCSEKARYNWFIFSCLCFGIKGPLMLTVAMSGFRPSFSFPQQQFAASFGVFTEHYITPFQLSRFVTRSKAKMQGKNPPNGPLENFWVLFPEQT